MVVKSLVTLFERLTDEFGDPESRKADRQASDILMRRVMLDGGKAGSSGIITLFTQHRVQQANLPDGTDIDINLWDDTGKVHTIVSVTTDTGVKPVVITKHWDPALVRLKVLQFVQRVGACLGELIKEEEMEELVERAR